MYNSSLKQPNAYATSGIQAAVIPFGPEHRLMMYNSITSSFQNGVQRVSSHLDDLVAGITTTANFAYERVTQELSYLTATLYSKMGGSKRRQKEKRRKTWDTRRAEKTVFGTQNFKMTKISPNLFKFGVKTLHHVSCPASEASAKTRSGSGLFCCFSAWLNLLFKIFIFALVTCMRAQ